MCGLLSVRQSRSVVLQPLVFAGLATGYCPPVLLSGAICSQGNADAGLHWLPSQHDWINNALQETGNLALLEVDPSPMSVCGGLYVSMPGEHEGSHCSIVIVQRPDSRRILLCMYELVGISVFKLDSQIYQGT